MSDGATRVSSGMNNTIRDIREIAGQHSDEDIYAMLKECSMDPNETAQRLLHLDIFHEVKKKNGRQFHESAENRVFNNPEQQQRTRACRGAKVESGNFHIRNASQTARTYNGRRFLGGGKENGYNKSNKSTGHHTESKSTPQISRLDRVKVNGSDNLSKEENTNGEAHQASASEINCAEHELAAQNQLTGTVANSEQPNCAAKDAESKEADTHEEDSISETDVSVVLEDSSKLNISDAQHVVFPENLQVPEAYKKKLTFGSFDGIWAVDAKQTNECNVIDSDSLIDVSCPPSDSIMGKSSTESNEVILSTVEVAQENDDPSYLPSSSAMSGGASPMTRHAMPDVVIKIDEPESEKLMRNGDFEPSKSADNGFCYASQAHNNAEPQDGNFTASTSRIGPTITINPPGSSRDLVSTPPSAPILRQTYHPNLFPHGQYYPQFFAPQLQHYLAHGGLPQPPMVNPYLTSPVAAGIKFPHPHSKQESTAGTESYIGVPSGYFPYALPYGLPPVVIPGNRVGDDNDHETKSKENTTTHTTEKQIESSGEWMGGAGRTVSGRHVNPFYNIGLGQGHQMVFPPIAAAYGAFSGFYNPSVQSIPVPQPVVNSQIRQPQSLGPGEPAVGQSVMLPSGFYQQQQQPQGAHIIWNDKQ